MAIIMNAIEKIHSLDKFGSRPGLDRIRRFLDILGNPQDSLRFIHVAGTNGKGSTCAMLSAVLTDAGYKTGLFISPYIVDFRERIQINGRMISSETLESAVERTFPIIERLSAEGCVITEFEYVMALEFLIHSEEKCDVVILETGLGGLLDCTNVIKPPLCSVITKIGLDHTAVLGETIEEIAAQKCGIIKSGTTVSSAQTDRAMRVIEADCLKKNVRLIKSGELKLELTSDSLDGLSFKYNETEINLPLIGAHQLENAKTALAALEVVRKNLPLSNDNIRKGFAKAVNPARFEVISKNPLVILDGAHNPDGINALTNAVNRYLPDRAPILILGMLADKDSKSSIKILGESFGEVYAVPVNNPRSLSAEALADECRGHFDSVKAFDDPFSAIDSALDRAVNEQKPLVIAGSLYLAGEIRNYLLSKT